MDSTSPPCQVLRSGKPSIATRGREGRAGGGLHKQANIPRDPPRLDYCSGEVRYLLQLLALVDK